MYYLIKPFNIYKILINNLKTLVFAQLRPVSININVHFK
jgi:hypothetical protein